MLDSNYQSEWGCNFNSEALFLSECSTAIYAVAHHITFNTSVIFFLPRFSSWY